MHNDIMVAGSKERPPMLASGSCAQWKSQFMIYVDTKPNRELLKQTIYKGPYIMTEITHPETPEDGDRLMNGIENDIYFTIYACPHTKEMWIAIERLQQGESINIQDVKTKLFWEFGKFTSRDGESIESYYTRFYKIMNKMQQKNLDNVSYHTLFDVLKQHQNEVNEIRTKRMVRNANPLALVIAAQHYPDDYT
ncbi:hypothetical protein Tco_1191496 [Tanacetum coccineum]